MKNITGYDFADDMNKMHDFMLLSKDEFLSSYSYLNEDDYYATYNAIMEMLKEKHPYMEMEEIQKFVDKHNNSYVENR